MDPTLFITPKAMAKKEKSTSFSMGVGEKIDIDFMYTQIQQLRAKREFTKMLFKDLKDEILTAVKDQLWDYSPYTNCRGMTTTTPKSLPPFRQRSFFFCVCTFHNIFILDTDFVPIPA